MFDVLLPSKLASNKEDLKTRTYGLTDIGKLAERLKLNKDKAIAEWQALTVEIADSPDLCHQTSLAPEIFWSKVLTDYRSLGAEVRNLIRIVLVLPATSADSERAISVMKFIKSPRRNSMKRITLEDLMRVKLNGPAEIEYFPRARYAKTWRGMKTEG